MNSENRNSEFLRVLSERGFRLHPDIIIQEIVPQLDDIDPADINGVEWSQGMKFVDDDEAKVQARSDAYDDFEFIGARMGKGRSIAQAKASLLDEYPKHVPVYSRILISIVGIKEPRPCYFVFAYAKKYEPKA